MNSLAEALKEYYDTAFLSPQEFAKYWLIARYQDRVSTRLLAEKAALLVKGREQCAEVFREMIYGSNPLLATIPKHDSFGKYYPLPIKFK